MLVLLIHPIHSTLPLSNSSNYSLSLISLYSVLSTLSKMCSSKTKLGSNMIQPNRAPLLERRNNSSSPMIAADSATMFLPSAFPPTIKIRSKTTDDQPSTTTTTAKRFNKSKSFSYACDYAPGSIAAARREEVAILHEQRKMRTAHYGRAAAKSKLLPPVHDHDHNPDPNHSNDKRCSFITPNSDPIYVAYHDLEWGVPVHNDEMLFELLVLTGAQVGSDWSSVLKRRQDFRDAFSGFDVGEVSKYSEKKINSISTEYRIELSQVRGAVDNSKRILQIKNELGSFDKYLWGFVNGKAIATAYKSSQKIPAKTSKSETISKDMVRRGFRQVGPTVIHSFLQAAGLTNDHLITCPRHSQLL